MTECVILYRVNNGPVQFVADADGEIAVYPHQDTAIDYALNNKLFESGQAAYQIVELDEI